MVVENGPARRGWIGERCAVKFAIADQHDLADHVHHMLGLLARKLGQLRWTLGKFGSQRHLTAANKRLTVIENAANRLPVARSRDDGILETPAQRHAQGFVEFSFLSMPMRH